MKARFVFRLSLSVMFLLLAASSGLAHPLDSDFHTMNNAISAAAQARWFRSEVDTAFDTGLHTSIVYEPYNDNPWVSYYDNTIKNLRLAEYVGRGLGNCFDNDDWICRTLDSSGNVGLYSSIASDPTKVFYLGIAYHDVTYRSLKFIEFSKTSTPWDVYFIDIAPPTNITTGLYTSTAYDTAGTAHISYYTNNTAAEDALMLAYDVNMGGNCGYGTQAGKWRCDTVHSGEGIGQYTSLDVDAAGNAHIAYYDATGGALWYATNSTGTNCGPGDNTWTCYPVSSLNDVGKYSSMYVDSANNFHIAYYDATDDVLKYVTKVSGGGNCGLLGSAQCETIDDMPADYHPVGLSIAEDAAGYPIIAYQSQYGDLNVARPLAALGLPAGSGNCGPENLFFTWYCETIHRYPRFTIARHADYVSIDVNSAGLASIAYYEFITSSGGNLGVAQQRFEVFQPLVMKNQ